MVFKEFCKHKHSRRYTHTTNKTEAHKLFRPEERANYLQVVGECFGVLECALLPQLEEPKVEKRLTPQTTRREERDEE